MDQSASSMFAPRSLLKDFTASIVVFLVAMPLCLGIALASGAPLFSGLLAGIIGGIIVGSLSGSHTSVSGPAAGLTAVVAMQIGNLGSFDAFLLAVFVAGILQIGLGIAKAGALSAFFPSSVIKGLLAAIGVILILKQIPHLVGHDSDPSGEMSYNQPDKHNTFSELLTLFQGQIHAGAAVVGLISLVLLVVWYRVKPLKNTGVPGPLVVVLVGVALQLLFSRLSEMWAIKADHLVQIPIAENITEFATFLQFPDFGQWNNPAIYVAAVTIAIVASLETLLNLEATDKLDKLKRHSPSSRELVAQGAGNTVAGLIGAIPVTSVIVRSSVNVNSGAQSKLSTIFHGFLLLTFVSFFPSYLNMIPLSCLAAILIVTGFNLASPKLFMQMWREGRYQFAPFIITVGAIVFTDLLIGILIGLGVSVLFILNSNLRRPIRRIVETHIDGDIVHVELANQVSFLNRASLDKVFREAPRGTNFLIDASDSDYIDPDILALVREFKDQVGPARGIRVSLRGFRTKYDLKDEIQFADYSTREMQDRLTPAEVMKILQEGNNRFRSGKRLSRDFNRQIDGTADGQSPFAVVLSCIDSRVPTELVFDLGIGDTFSVRVAGNVIGTKSLGSIEYGVLVAGAKLVLVMGHTRCGAVTAALQMSGSNSRSDQPGPSSNVGAIVSEIQQSIDRNTASEFASAKGNEQDRCIDAVARQNVQRTVREVLLRSNAIREAVEAGSVMVVGAMYDVKTGNVEMLTESNVEVAV
jgi:carbonic anhydrase